MSAAVVVIAHDRPHSLHRLLRSLGSASFADDVPLVIGVDAGHAGSRRVAEEFAFPHGPKTVLVRPARLGLVAHVRACADLVDEHGAVVLLEDDLLVAPHFHAWATQALAFYAGDARVAGVSLYRYGVAESCPAPFEPLDDGSDVHFLQMASSWGQAFSHAQWEAFRAWDAAHDDALLLRLPAYVRRWTGPSWKRRFLAYLLATGRTFVYPPVSLTTNFGDPGTSAVTRGLYQVPLDGHARSYRFATLDASRATYDAWFEPTRACLFAWTDALRGHPCDVDLYGVKTADELTAPYLLTTRRAETVVREYDLGMIPNVAAVVHGVAGSGIVLARREHVDLTETQPLVHQYRFASVAEEAFRARPEPVAGLRERPLVSVVTAEERPGDAAGVAAALEAQGHPHVARLEHVVAGADAIEETRHRWHAPTHVRFPAVPGSAPDERVIEALSRTHGDIVGCLPPGSLLVPGALHRVLGIFGAFPDLAWLATLSGRPEPGRGIVAAETPGAAMARVLAPALAVPWTGVFWRRSLWESAVAPGARVHDRAELWTRFGVHASLHLAFETVAARDHHPRPADAVVPAAVPAASVTAVDELPNGAANAPRRAGALRGLLRAGTRPLLGTPLRLVHVVTRLLPYVVIWDSASGAFALWHYPARNASRD